MAMGLTNSGATLCQLIDTLFGPEYEGKIFWYIDDVLLASETFEEHLELIKVVAEKLSFANLAISLEKSKFCMKQLKFLGVIIEKEGIRPDLSNIQPMIDFPKPKSVSAVRRILGMIGWHRRFIQAFSEITAPITELLKKKTGKFVWTNEANEALENLKLVLTSAPILASADFSKPFNIHCDASDIAVGGVLTQMQDGVERVIAYMSQKLTDTQRRYHTTEKECYAIIVAFEKFRMWIDGCPSVRVITDHASLLWLKNLKNPNGRLMRWALRLQNYNFSMIHRKGKFHALPDALSRAFASIEIRKFSQTNDEWYLKAYDDAIKAENDESPVVNCKYKIINEVLYKEMPINERVDTNNLKICVPYEYRLSILTESHDAKTSAHAGFYKMLNKIRTNYYWPKMHQHILDYVNNCTVCKTVKPPNENMKVPIGSFRDPEQPWQWISSDHCGPFVRSRSGNRFLCVVVDNFTKFVVLKPMKKASTKELIEFVKNDVFLRYGTCKVFTSDNGPAYKSQSYEEFMNMYGVKHFKTAYYNPKANSTEIYNKSINNAVRSYIEENHDRWDENLNEIAFALNQNINSTTKMSPFYANFGRHPITNGAAYEQPQ